MNGPVGFAGNTSNKQDYRDLLVAKITAKYTPTNGPFSGRPVYTWVEQQISMTGSDEDTPSPRKGTYTSGIDFDNILVDVNDSDITVDSYVWARMKGVVLGATVYETVRNTVSPSQADCRRLLSALKTTECIRLISDDGGGGTYPFDVTAVWDAGASGWVGQEQITTGDGLTTITLVRGLGYYYLKLVGQTTTWYGEDVDCVDGERVFAADGDPTDTTADCTDHSFLTRVSCAACGDVCTGWYCWEATGEVFYVEDCDAKTALESALNGSGTGVPPEAQACEDAPAVINVALSSTVACIGARSTTSTRFTTSGGVGYVVPYPGLGWGDCFLDSGFALSCNSGVWLMGYDSNAYTLVSATASPWSQVWRYTGPFSGDNGAGTATFVLTGV